jgi:signal transduction histidine kinase
MKTLTHYLKQFAAWATDLTDSYRFNPFIKAVTNIVVILVIMTGLLIAISGWAIQYAQNNTVGSISYHIQQAVRGSPTAVQTLPEAINDVRTRTLTYVFAGLVALVILFGLLLVRFALLPTRASLQLQKKFIGNVAHEIRTPLAIIKTTTEVELMNPDINASQKESLESTVVELNRISDIINNLLSFDALLQPSRMKNQPVDMYKLAETVTARHKALADSRGVSLTLLSTNKRFVMGNPVALEQVITNLVKNAINYTPAHKDGTVHISIENDYRGRVLLAVIDSGVGIGQDDLYHVLEPFYRADSSRTRGLGSVGTSGLGLAIVNEITRMHRGTISIKSSLGHGTTVAVAFPAAPGSPTIETPLFENPLQAQEEGVHEISLDFS